MLTQNASGRLSNMDNLERLNLDCVLVASVHVGRYSPWAGRVCCGVAWIHLTVKACLCVYEGSEYELWCLVRYWDG